VLASILWHAAFQLLPCGCTADEARKSLEAQGRERKRLERQLAALQQAHDRLLQQGAGGAAGAQHPQAASSVQQQAALQQLAQEQEQHKAALQQIQERHSRETSSLKKELSSVK
jgi:hypothetical protein